MAYTWTYSVPARGTVINTLLWNEMLSFADTVNSNHCNNCGSNNSNRGNRSNLSNGTACSNRSNNGNNSNGSQCTSNNGSNRSGNNGNNSRVYSSPYSCSGVRCGGDAKYWNSQLLYWRTQSHV